MAFQCQNTSTDPRFDRQTVQGQASMDPRFDRQTVQGQVRKLRGFLSVLIGLVISCILQVVGLATPGWLVLRNSASTVEIGLWVIKVCVLGQCNSISETDQSLGVSTKMLQYQAETCTALVAMVIAIVFFCFLRREPCNRSGNIKVSVSTVVVLTLVSGILAVTAAGTFGNEVRKYYDLLNAVGENPFMVPYSLILTGVGGILAGVMALMILFTVRPWKSDSAPPPYYEMPAPPASGLYPGQPQHAPPPYYEMPAPPATGVSPDPPQHEDTDQRQSAAAYAGQPPYGQDTDIILANI